MGIQCRTLQVDVQLDKCPVAASDERVLHARLRQVLRRLDNVDPGVKEFFAPAAKLVLQSEDPQDAMCAALAALSGLMEVPKPRR